jgi:hypothetical protein
MQDTDNNDNVERRGRSKSPKRFNQSKKSLSPGASSSGSPSSHKSRKEKNNNSSSPSSKFNNKDFKKKKSLTNEQALKRKNAISKAKGLKLDSSSWSRIELLSKIRIFAIFTEDIKTNNGKLIINNNYNLLSDDIIVINELLLRSTEITIVNLNNCYLDDNIYLQLHQNLLNLRHLQELYLNSNLLTHITAERICKDFSKKNTRNLFVLDMTNNINLTFHDGCYLYSSFYKNINILNNLSIKNILDNDIQNLFFSNKQIKSCELGIICQMCCSKHLSHIASLDLSMNLLTSHDLSYLISYLNKMGDYLISLDLSRNSYITRNTTTITNDNNYNNNLKDKDKDRNYQGINDLLSYLKLNTRLQYVNIDDNMLSEDIMNKVIHSTMVNRIITQRNQKPVLSQLLSQLSHSQQQQQQQQQQQYDDHQLFESYLSKLIIQKAKPDPSSHEEMLRWKPSINMIDRNFVINNKLPEVDVEVDLSSSLDEGKDEIYLISREFRKI